MGRPREFDADSAIEAAMDVFWTRGYAGTTPADLCARTGLGKGSLYNAFGSKRELFEKALEHYCRVGIENYASTLRTDAPIRDRIREMMNAAAISDPDDPRRRGCLAINAAIELGFADERAADQVGRHFDQIEDELRAALERARSDGEIAPDRDTRATARLVMSAFYGMHVLGRTSRDPRRLVDIIDTTVAAV